MFFCPKKEKAKAKVEVELKIEEIKEEGEEGFSEEKKYIKALCKNIKQVSEKLVKLEPQTQEETKIEYSFEISSETETETEIKIRTTLNQTLIGTIHFDQKKNTLELRATGSPALDPATGKQTSEQLVYTGDQAKNTIAIYRRAIDSKLDEKPVVAQRKCLMM